MSEVHWRNAEGCADYCDSNKCQRFAQSPMYARGVDRFAEAWLSCGFGHCGATPRLAAKRFIPWPHYFSKWVGRKFKMGDYVLRKVFTELRETSAQRGRPLPKSWMYRGLSLQTLNGVGVPGVGARHLQILPLKFDRMSDIESAILSVGEMAAAVRKANCPPHFQQSHRLLKESLIGINPRASGERLGLLGGRVAGGMAIGKELGSAAAFRLGAHGLCPAEARHSCGFVCLLLLSGLSSALDIFILSLPIWCGIRNRRLVGSQKLMQRRECAGLECRKRIPSEFLETVGWKGPPLGYITFLQGSFLRGEADYLRRSLGKYSRRLLARSTRRESGLQADKQFGSACRTSPRLEDWNRHEARSRDIIGRGEVGETEAGFDLQKLPVEIVEKC
ncbi:hypothetical protein FNV43_RR10900 [Rhamnella rubrinervis]|uniref:Uncharacterized protein n=1 Tax=Rhamnella rubrinervis TaxID=2594499 RepID=A0A8K0H532_9ROSA|nr:hypothetical protein FNV43_RR10900 [Rhamnella rubrinervis]